MSKTTRNSTKLIKKRGMSAENMASKKSIKHHKGSQLDISLEGSSIICKGPTLVTVSKKSRTECDTMLQGNELGDLANPLKKFKMDKKKSSTLGVVDVDVLRQAEKDFQLQMTESVLFKNSHCNEKEQSKKTKKHGRKAKVVSFKEPVEEDELLSKKQKQMAGQDSLSDDTSEKSETEQPAMKIKHTEHTLQIVSHDKPSDGNRSGSKQPSKLKKHNKHILNKAQVEDHEEVNESKQNIAKINKNQKEDKQKVLLPSEREDTTRNEKALQYLRLWGSNKSTWKFNKMMQVQLLHDMYDTSIVTDKDFKILLLYLNGIKGKGREKTKEDARKILSSEDTEVSTSKEDRARQLYQMLV